MKYVRKKVVIKLTKNSVFDKTTENLRKKVIVELTRY